MVHAFLASSGTEAAHASFWAEDLIYTSSAGLRFGKADIMAGFEDTDTAVVAFKLVGTPTDESAQADVLYYFNTGTFMKREGVWKVIAWQATKVPPTEESANRR